MHGPPPTPLVVEDKKKSGLSRSHFVCSEVLSQSTLKQSNELREEQLGQAVVLKIRIARLVFKRRLYWHSDLGKAIKARR